MVATSVRAVPIDQKCFSKFYKLTCINFRLKFQYNLTDALEGFYLSTYLDKQGNQR